MWQQPQLMLVQRLNLAAAQRATTAAVAAVIRAWISALSILLKALPGELRLADY